MPNATANVQETIRLDLKSLPGGYVEAKRLTYGEKIQRRAMTAGLKIQGGKKKTDDFMGEMQLITEESTIFDFAHCIVDHNLYKDDDEQVPFDLTKKTDVRMLDPRIGEEIDNWLSEINNFEDEDTEGN